MRSVDFTRERLVGRVGVLRRFRRDAAAAPPVDAVGDGLGSSCSTELSVACAINFRKSDKGAPHRRIPGMRGPLMRPAVPDVSPAAILRSSCANELSGLSPSLLSLGMPLEPSTSPCAASAPPTP